MKTVARFYKVSLAEDEVTTERSGGTGSTDK